MGEAKSTLAEEIAQAAMAFQRECTGHAPRRVSVVLGEKTLVITLFEALSPAEKEMGRTPEGATRVREYYRQLFHDSAAAFHERLSQILATDICESAADIHSPVGRLIETFPAGDIVQVFRLSSPVAAQAGSSPPSSPKTLESPLFN